jgi:hypothetical protein
MHTQPQQKYYKQQRDVHGMTSTIQDKSTWAIGGGVLMGIGIGFFFLQQSALAFVGSILAGLGLGLFVSAWISRK